MAKKGFFLTLTMVVVLTFMITSVGMWSRVVEAREAGEPQKLKTASFAQVLDEITDEKLSEFAGMSAYYAMYRLANHTVAKHTALPYVATGGDLNNQGTPNVNASIYELMWNGSTRGNGAGGSAWSVADTLTYENANKMYTLSNWSSRMSDTVGQMGFNFSMGNIRDFSIRQTGPWDAAVAFNVTVNISDKEGTFFMQRNLSANASFSLVGFVDPMIAYHTYQDTKLLPFPKTPERQIFKNDNWRTLLSVQPRKIKDGNWKYGVGWFYGNLTSANPDLTNPAAYQPRNRWVLLIDDPTSANYVSKLTEFGAVAIRSVPLDVPGAPKTVPAPFNSALCSGFKPNPPGPPIACQKTVTVTCQYQIHQQTKCVNCLEWTTTTCDVSQSTSDPDPACVCSTPQLTPQQALDNCRAAGQCDNIAPHINSNQVDGLVYTVGAGDPTEPGSPLDAPAGSGIFHILIDNEYDSVAAELAAGKVARDATATSSAYHRVWDIEKMRDMAVSGLYVERPNEAPSYFQRFLGDSALTSPYGIETFLVGMWAGGTDDIALNAKYSRADHKFYSGADATNGKIKGMPGCTNKMRCDDEDNPDTTKRSPLGYFRLDNSHITDYLVTQIACPALGGSGAKCDT